LNTNSRLKIPAAGRKIRPVRFALVFFCCFVFGIAVLLTAPVQSVDRRFTQGLVALSHKIITICGGHATRQGASAGASKDHKAVSVRSDGLFLRSVGLDAN
jgi:hypothetical protein